MLEEADALDAFVAECKADGLTDAVLLGMGGSSLAPEVFRLSYGDAGGLRLHVLDSTEPLQIEAVTAAIDLAKTLFIVSTKSGGTIETLSLFKHFHALQGDGGHFIAVTDPGSSLADLAEEHGFRRTFINDPDIGGRYSALSYFGLVPAALAGIDVRPILEGAQVAEQACSDFEAPEDNAGLWLGLALGRARARRPRQAHLRRRRPARLVRHLGRAARRGEHGQGGPRHPPDRRRAAAGARRLRVRPRVPAPAQHRGARRRPRREHRRARRGRAPDHHRPRRRARRPRARVLPVGVRHRRRRLGAGDQPVRPAQRPAGQGRDAEGARRGLARPRGRRPRRAAGRPRAPGLPGDHGLPALLRGDRGRGRAAARGGRSSATTSPPPTATARASCTRPGSSTRAARRSGASSSS